MIALPVHRFRARDGLELAYRELGEGTPVVLLHGFTSSGEAWLRSGLAEQLAERGFRVLLPDFRGHGASPRPGDPAGYPPDVLVDDGLAFAEQLGLTEYALGGYSLGARVAFRMVVRGARPSRILLGGQGLAAMRRGGGGGPLHRVLAALTEGRAVEPAGAGTAHRIARLGTDPHALMHVLRSVVPTDDLTALTIPALVAVGGEDAGHADAEPLARLVNAEFAPVPGDHHGAPASPEFTAAAVRFFGGGRR
ncbi:alpha/beta hydrolase [Amycolatopsis rubida]|uniref:Alpha/beta hydrolase n=1 Tax=Amycolatopsis rubida TaxID=112413 RepID=A0ABX0BPR4_9PSEU|nr:MULTISPECIES: alpha/beta hydrolase [Amycolatopsis]MYW90597.1 alpha/beta fold hydrolase [Amycolatopsis rubida]NEC55578.1 alpha/beta hydrolase [Amycolatopsis rubida]OAP29072.1 Non-heme chloroperoxidase [Amycolatopsis sp. M39]